MSNPAKRDERALRAAAERLDVPTEWLRQRPPTAAESTVAIGLATHDLIHSVRQTVEPQIVRLCRTIQRALLHRPDPPPS